MYRSRSQGRRLGLRTSIYETTPITVLQSKVGHVSSHAASFDDTCCSEGAEVNDPAVEFGDATVEDPSKVLPDRRARNRQRRRDEVYGAAVELFIEQGFDKTRMDEIADRADVARATVFNHFPKKTAFLDEWTARRRARAAGALTSEDTSAWTLEQKLHRYMTEMARMSEETRDETRALLAATLQQTNFLAHPALAEEMAAMIRSAREAGEAPASIHAGQAGLIIATAYFAVLDQWIAENPPPFDLEQELLIVVNVVLHGIYSPREPLSANGAGDKTPPRSSQPTASGARSSKKATSRKRTT
jgi:AcrR family transcriptional regulator